MSGGSAASDYAGGQGPPAATPQNVPQPLGVPPGYRAPLQDTGTEDADAAMLGAQAQSLTNRPRYYAGSQWGQVEDFPSDTDGIIQLQQMLMQAGYLNPKAVIIGQWDATSAGAFSQLLASANQRGTDWKTALARSLSTADQTAALQATTRQPKVTRLTNPDDIRAAAQSAARSLYGGDLTPEEEQRFIASYQGMEAQATDAAYAAGTPGTAGGTFTDAPSLETAALNEIKKDHPEQVFASAFGKGLKNLTQTLGQPGGGWL